MKIDREKLVELLVDKTGMQQEQVEEQLTELINRIHKASDEGKKFEIKEFGTFSMQEGQLQFTPSDKLKTEINNKYAGMEPIELIGSYQDADEDEQQKDRSEIQEEGEPEPVDDVEGEAEEDETSVQETPEPEDEEEPDEIEAREQQEADPFAELEEEADDEEAGAPEPEEQEPETEEKEPKKEGIIWGLDEEAEDEEEDEELKEFERKVAEALNQDTEVTESKETTESVEEEIPESEDEEEPEVVGDREPEEEAGAPEPVRAKPKKDLRNIGHRRDRKNSSTMTILVAAASIIIIAISVWLAYDLGVFTDLGSDSAAGDGRETEQQVASATQQNNLPEASPDESGQPDNQHSVGNTNTETSEGQADQQQPESDAQQQKEPDAENEVANEGDDESASSVYGLKGSLTQAGNDGYTLIVLSMRYEDRSREVYRGLKQQGYRTLIVSAMVNGDTFWRVGVGQFETIENAQQASKDLPEPYRDNYFIKRIQ